MPNLLARETSPYLLQHADNPVDWHPWGAEALELARREDRPILLSIGYSSCHWCHVMAHESFEDPQVAAAMNRLFVNIKVDREERPDLDQVYQAAHQILSGRAGGWPLNLFLGPDRVPFFSGTYFPREPRFGLPGFIDLLEDVAQAYRTRHADIERQNAVLLAAMNEGVASAPPTADLSDAPVQAALKAMKRGFDPLHGGYGGAPKFPRPTDLEFLLHSGDPEAREQVLVTLRHMAEGGLMDQLGGGFFRYSVDERWAIPHFEKMLYDNGPLLGLYADAWALSGDPVYLRAADLTAGWLAAEMASPEGAFHAALDADSEHEEGRFYLWTPDTVRALLSAEEYAVAAPHWGLDRAANFEDRDWHLGMAAPLAEVAANLGISVAEAEAHRGAARRKLLAARTGRERPVRDDKVLTAWNALAIRGLAHAARLCGRADWAALARQATGALHALVWREGRLMATWKDGQARHGGYLDDYAFLLDALLELAEVDSRSDELAWARQLADALLTHFEDGKGSGFWFTAHDHERLIQRNKPIHDGATPAGNGVAVGALLRLGRLLNERTYREAAVRTLQAFQPAMAVHPAACPGLLRVLAEITHPAGRDSHSRQ